MVSMVTFIIHGTKSNKGVIGMGSWIIRWNFDRSSYQPGDHALVSFWLENTGSTHLYLSELSLKFDFGTYNIESISGMIPPRTTKFLGSIRLEIPRNVVGRRIFTIKYRMYERINDVWVDLGYYQSNKQYFISIYPKPLYKVFVSRGLSTEDRAIGDPIVEMIKEWGFETVTVGVEVKVAEELVARRVKEEIRKADALIAIATPRHLDALTGLWRTLEWLHGEVGIAFGVDKPILILKDKRVTLGGLPSYLKWEQIPIIEFDPYNLEELRIKLSTVMPGFREWIEAKRRQEFFNALAKLACVATPIIIAGIIGFLIGTSRR